MLTLNFATTLSKELRETTLNRCTVIWIVDMVCVLHSIRTDCPVSPPYSFKDHELFLTRTTSVALSGQSRPQSCWRWRHRYTARKPRGRIAGIASGVGCRRTALPACLSE